jgi:hypothetical protein
MEPMLQFFEYAHLPAHLQAISQPFWYVAHNHLLCLPRNPERTAAFRKLLEAKDCAVRAAIYKDDTGPVTPSTPTTGGAGGR